MLTEILIGLLVIIVLYVLKKDRDKYEEMKTKGIKHFCSDSILLMLRRKNVFDVMGEMFKKYPDEPMFGIFVARTPFIIVQDIDYIERICTKDFSHFTDRGFEIYEEVNPLDAMLFFLPGNNRWRTIRNKLSPLFTSGRLRTMYSSMHGCCDKFMKYLENVNRVGLNMRETSSLFFMEITASTIFGLDAKVLENPDSEFRRMGKRVFDFGIRDTVVGLVINILPSVARLLSLSFNKPDVTKYFVGIISKAFEERAKSGIQRPDLIQLMMQLKQKGSLEVTNWDPNDDYLKNSEDQVETETIELTDSILMSQAYLFMVAGIDMFGLTTSYIALDLALNPEIQEKVREEVKRAIDKNGGLTFDALREMTYLECVCKESQRLHPTALQLMRQCTKDYTFPNGYTVKKGERLLIPLLGVHKNPNYFSDPEEFKPERFDGQENAKRAFLSFGDGPRICIAMRFAFLLLKLATATLLLNYKIKVNPSTVLPMKISPLAGFLIPQSPLLFDLEKLTEDPIHENN